jgi:hypothetical protein
MHTPIECSGCGKHIGDHIIYPWTAYGQDSPEDIYFDNDSVVYGKSGTYCDEQCMLEAQDKEI